MNGQPTPSIIAAITMVFAALSKTIVTVAVKSDVLIDKTFSTAIHGVGAAEHIAKAVEDRAEIYGTALVSNGSAAEREHALKLKIRLHGLEAQEKASRPRPSAKARK